MDLQLSISAHPLDRFTPFVIDRWAAQALARFPAPLPPKSGAVPAHEGFRANKDERWEDRWKQVAEPDEEGSITIGQLDATRQLAAQHDQLLSQRYILRFKPRPGLERRREDGQE